MYTSILFQFALLPFLALAQGTATQAAGPQETGPKLFNGGEDNPVDPSTAGAEGSSKGAFSLSRGAIAAIITVAVLVAVGGSEPSTTLPLLRTVLICLSSCIRDSFLAGEEASVGRSTVSPSRLPPSHRPWRQRRFVQQ